MTKRTSVNLHQSDLPRCRIRLLHGEPARIQVHRRPRSY